MRIIEINEYNDFLALKETWQSVLLRYDHHTIFSTWEWLMCWWKYFGNNKRLVLLLVEDDEAMRSLTRQMLEEHGYRVVEAEDGKSALEQVGADHEIDLTLTDVVMRGMSGPELVLRLTEAHPEMKIVYMSGYTGELVSDRKIDAGITLLEKPFTRMALLKTVHAALG